MFPVHSQEGYQVPPCSAGCLYNHVPCPARRGIKYRHAPLPGGVSSTAMLRWLPMRGDGPQKSLDVPLHQKMGSLFTQAPTGVEHEDTATDGGLEPRLEPRDRLTFLEDELEGSREWKFRVEAETLPGETVCVTGDCRSLGGWASSKVLQLSQETSNVWSSMVAIPAKRDVQYRYVVCVIIQPDGHTITDTHIIVRHWETHTIPRLVTAKARTNVEDSDVLDVYGHHAHYRKVDRGWLTTNTVIQLKLHGKLLVFWKKKLEGRKMYVKVSPVNLVRQQSQEGVSAIENIDESMDTHDGPEEPDLWPIAEIAAMNEEDRTFHLQNQFGNACTSDDFVIFNISVLFPETVVSAGVQQQFMFPPWESAAPRNYQPLTLYGNYQPLTLHKNYQLFTLHRNYQPLTLYGNYLLLTLHRNYQPLTLYGNYQPLTLYGNYQLLTLYGNYQLLTLYKNYQLLTPHRNYQPLTHYGNYQPLTLYGNYQPLTLHMNYQSHSPCELSTSHSPQELSTSHSPQELSTSHTLWELSTSHSPHELSTSHTLWELSTSHSLWELSTSHSPQELSASHSIGTINLTLSTETINLSLFTGCY
uniref:CBM20 domain-containing protein n=1 Tax=Timema monikensis TaxID=170555 RepID=A0A7R9HLT9_9NEOP|nr:unnamed protein product [Timema monikensis]